MSTGSMLSAKARPDVLVRETAATLQTHVEQHVEDCARYIKHAMPELQEDELSLGLLESAGDNFRVLFAALRDGTPVAETHAPRGAIAYAEIMVRRGVPLAALLRAYRFGISFLWDLWRSALAETQAPPEAQVAALDDAMRVVFDYVDRTCDAVTDAYAAALERWNRGAAALRAETVQQLLDGAPVDLDAAAARLGYAMRREHLAFVLAAEPEPDGDDVLRRLEAAGQWVAGALGCARPLLVPQGRAALWLWVGSEQPVGPGVLDDLGQSHPELRGITVACGQPGHDLEGFRRSHQQAQAAAAVAALGGRGAGRVTPYAKVVVSSLMLAEPDAAREFVDRELGPLGGEDDSAHRVRSTLRVFLDEGCRASTTARRLGIHQNTVAYRLHQAEEMLGHPIVQRRFEVEAALRLFSLLKA